MQSRGTSWRRQALPWPQSKGEMEIEKEHPREGGWWERRRGRLSRPESESWGPSCVGRRPDQEVGRLGPEAAANPGPSIGGRCWAVHVPGPEPRRPSGEELPGQGSR